MLWGVVLSLSSAVLVLLHAWWTEQVPDHIARPLLVIAIGLIACCVAFRGHFQPKHLQKVAVVDVVQEVAIGKLLEEAPHEKPLPKLAQNTKHGAAVPLTSARMQVKTEAIPTATKPPVPVAITTCIPSAIKADVNHASFDDFDLDTGDDDLPQAPKASRISHAGLAGLPVLLHVYDVSNHSGVQAINHVLAHKYAPLRLGGVFHAGVEVAGREYSFGYAPQGTGVTHCTPRKHPGHHYRETCEMRRTLLSKEDVQTLIGLMAREYQGSSYHLFRRNCCTFAAELCKELGVGALPPWIQRLANVGDSVLGASEELARKAPLSCAIPDPGAASIAWQRESLEAVNAKDPAVLTRRRTM